MTGDCPDDETLAAALHGAADAALLAHLDGCVTCRDTVALLAAESSPRRVDERDKESTAADTEVPIGTSIGRYVVLGRLGRGGMGTVYGVYDPELDRKVALKLLAPQKDTSAVVREATLLAKVAHPGVVAVHDAGTYRGRPFVVMALVTGRTFRAFVAEKSRSAGEILACLEPAIAGLAEAHERGIVHRDVKPENLLVDERDRAFVTDFGLALAEEADEPEGTLAGTLATMAPEQLRGERADARADQFALAVTLYEALEGRPPFAGKSRRERLAAIVAERPEPPKALPKPAQAALLRALSAEKEARFASISELRAALYPEPTASRHRSLAALVLAAAIPVAVFLGMDRRAGAICEGAESRFSTVWDGAHRARVRDALLATRSPFAQTSFDTAAALLDTYAAAFGKVSHEVCVSSRIRRDTSEATMDARNACLDELRLEARAVVASLEAGGPRAATNAVAVVGHLRPPELCLDPRRSVPGGAVPDVVQELAARVALGDPVEAMPAVERALASARASSDLRASARLAFVAGSAATQRGDFTRARAYLDDAVVDAERTGDTPLAARAHIELVQVVGGRLANVPEGERYGRHADALVAHLGSPPDLDTSRLLASATLLRRASRFEESTRVARAALEVAEAHLGAASLDAASAHYAAAIALSSLGRNDEAALHIDRAIAIRTKLLGPTHPDVGRALVNLATIEGERGDLARARDHVLAAKRLFASSNGEVATLDLAFVLTNLGVIEIGLGHKVVAAQAFREAVRIDRELLGDHPTTALALANLGDLEREEGNLSAARDAYEEGLSRLARSGARDVRTNAVLLAGRGQVAIALGDSSGIRSLEAALTMLAGPDGHVGLRAEVGLALARAIAARDPRRARAIATSARSDAVEAKVPLAPFDAQLASLGVAPGAKR